MFDVLVFTVASETVFRTGEGVEIDHFRSSSTPKIVETLISEQNLWRSSPISLESELYAEEIEFYEKVMSSMSLFYLIL